ncbi:MAG: hemerythrin domain-containing protein [Dehalococcoidia bacterium]
MDFFSNLREEHQRLGQQLESLRGMLYDSEPGNSVAQREATQWIVEWVRTSVLPHLEREEERLYRESSTDNAGSGRLLAQHEQLRYHGAQLAELLTTADREEQRWDWVKMLAVQLEMLLSAHIIQEEAVYKELAVSADVEDTACAQGHGECYPAANAHFAAHGGEIMADQGPAEILEQEHRVIEMVVAAASGMADAVEAGQAVDAGALRDVVDFMRNFADKCHHGKEEDLLFPALMDKGVLPTGCPLGVLIADHKKGRAAVGRLSDAIDGYASGDAEAKATVVDALRAIVDLYPGHIWKEDYLLFPMTNKILSSDERDALLPKFDAVEAEMGEDAHEKYHGIAHRLKSEFVGTLATWA